MHTSNKHSQYGCVDGHAADQLFLADLRSPHSYGDAAKQENYSSSCLAVGGNHCPGPAVRGFSFLGQGLSSKQHTPGTETHRAKAWPCAPLFVFMEGGGEHFQV